MRHWGREVVHRARDTGMGSVSPGSSSLSATQLAQLVSNAGFPASLVPTMTAVALRESAGNPTAVNMGTPTVPEQSYGLFQINVGPGGNAALVQAMGYTPQDLLDPTINAKVAAAIYGGNPANLNTAWLVNQPNYGSPGYTLADYLPTAQSAASQVLDTTAVTDTTGSGLPSPVDFVDNLTTQAGSFVSGLDFSDPVTIGIVSVVGIGLVLLLKEL